jgi:hypothetical protein
MTLGGQATSHGNQMSGLQARNGAAAVLLHFVVQDRLQSPFGEAPAHIADRGLAHIEGRCKLGDTPALGGFEQDASPGEGAGIGFASMHKVLQGRASSSVKVTAGCWGMALLHFGTVYHLYWLLSTSVQKKPL